MVNMDLVDLMYRYINKLINGDKLLEKLKSIDLTKYPEEEQKGIRELIKEVEKIKEEIPNVVDDAERERIEKVSKLLEDFKNCLTKTKGEGRDFFQKRIEELEKEKEITKDGGKLFETLFELLTNDEIVRKYALAMDAKETLDFITKYIWVPLPPVLNQEAFDDLVEVGKKEDSRESLWRLASNYGDHGLDFSHIEDYFIEKRDDYYLLELVSIVKSDLNIERLIEKVFSAKDKKFIDKVKKRAIKLDLFSQTQIDKLSTGSLLD